MVDYARLNPIPNPIPAERQGAKRHYGVHPYFTRRPYNVVRDYIRHYSREGDTVLDPFGGSGVTAIEAFLDNRVGIHNDINPLANFIAAGIAGLAEGKLSELQLALVQLETKCEPALERLPHLSKRALEAQMESMDLPDNVALPHNADVQSLYDLFDQSQLVALATIRAAILRLRNSHTRSAMLLAFSATLAKVNRTFLSAEGRAESRGGSSIFSIYRYKVAKEPVKLPIWPTFYERAQNVIAAKAEIDKIIDVRRHSSGWKGKFKIHKHDVLDLPKKLSAKVDYIFTDPPYGGHIAYLDLSTMWNAWLGVMPTAGARKSEIIVGGDEKHLEANYVERLSDSVRACVAILKQDRWMSIVFQHWNIEYFKAILSAAADSGAELRAAVSQVGDPIWSMHKKKGSDSVLAGELILTFLNTGRAQAHPTDRQLDLESEIADLIDGVEGPLYGELLFNKVVLRAWEKGAIDSLAVSKDQFSRMLQDFGWRYDPGGHYWLKSGLQHQLI